MLTNENGFIGIAVTICSLHFSKSVVICNINDTPIIVSLELVEVFVMRIVEGNAGSYRWVGVELYRGMV